MSKHLTKYMSALECLMKGKRHYQILGISNLGRLAGLSEEKIFADIRERAPDMPNFEIKSAILKSFATGGASHSTRKPLGASFNAKEALHAIINSRIDRACEGKILELSPVKIDWGAEQDGIELLNRLYNPADYLYVGDKICKYEDQVRHIRRTEEWIKSPDLMDYSLICPNPLTGDIGKTTDGKESYRSDSCVKTFRFCIAEFDNISREEQMAFWIAMIERGCHVSALIDSGNKSIHAWLPVNCANAVEWEEKIEFALFGNFLSHLGCDAGCRNESHLSRLAGHVRSETGKPQRLLYLNPEGRA